MLPIYVSLLWHGLPTMPLSPDQRSPRRLQGPEDLRSGPWPGQETGPQQGPLSSWTRRSALLII